MKTESLHFGMKVRHPVHGIGTVKSISEHTVDVRFDDLTRTVSPDSSGMTPAEPTATVTSLDRPLSALISETVSAVVDRLGLESPSGIVEQLAARWKNGNLVLRPADPTQSSKELPVETFFHKIVMMRNNLRVLEQKVNGHAGLADSEKVELQQYITRCYGSMTSFNVLFRNEADKFRGSSTDS
jgi:hypothetical protein